MDTIIYRRATKFRGNKLLRIRPQVFFRELTFAVLVLKHMCLWAIRIFHGINFREYGKSAKTAKVGPSKLIGYTVY